MFPMPIALGVALCEKILVEEETRAVSLIGTFRRVSVESFPASLSFGVHAILKEGIGRGSVEVVLSSLEDGEEIEILRGDGTFSDRMTEVRVLVRFRHCKFTKPGLYQVAVLVDRECIAQRPFEVFTGGSKS